jgi:cyclophilin family peptidyl-prolyl cis-trans isomerase
MTEITQNDVIDVGGGGGRCGEGVGVQSSTPAVTAGFAAGAGSDGGGGAEWQMVTRGKAKAEGPKRTTARARLSMVEEGDGLQHDAPDFEAASTAARKRKAEDSINDKLAAKSATITQLAMAQKQTAESQNAFLESTNTVLDRNKTLVASNQAMMDTIKAQGEKIKALEALLQASPRPSSYSEVTANSGTSVDVQSSQTSSASAGSSQVRKEKPQVQDDRAVSIDMGRFKGAKNNYNGIRDGLWDGLKVNKVTEKLMIKCLRPGPGDRIDVVFADKDEANKAKQHTH